MKILLSILACLSVLVAVGIYRSPTGTTQQRSQKTYSPTAPPIIGSDRYAIEAKGDPKWMAFREVLHREGHDVRSVDEGMRHGGALARHALGRATAEDLEIIKRGETKNGLTNPRAAFVAFGVSPEEILKLPLTERMKAFSKAYDALPE
jgi:hypothetical protein